MADFLLATPHKRQQIVEYLEACEETHTSHDDPKMAKFWRETREEVLRREG